MAVTFVNAESANASANVQSTGITVTKPSGVQNGDVMFAFVGKNDYSNTSNFACSGWTDISPATDGTVTGNDRHLNIFVKVIVDASGEAANYTFTAADNATRQMVGTIIAFRGVDTGTPQDVSTPAYGFVSNDSDPASQNATSATADALALTYLMICMNSGSALKTWGIPSGYSADANCNTGTTAGTLELQHGVAYKTLGAAGSTAGTAAWTGTPADTTSETLVVTLLVRAGRLPVTYFHVRPTVAAGNPAGYAASTW